VIVVIAQAVIFTVLVPGTVTYWLPMNILGGDRTVRHPAGWAPIALGTAIYFWCAAEFLLRGRGTPAIWFTRPIAFLIGKEPQRLVQASVYRYSRNPMYVGVLTVVAGEALLFGSTQLLWYAVIACVFFHLVVLFVEEPHLRRTRGDAYAQYCREVPRWFLRF
jgi:protein-S-isoprenylcysteine O-methyltransferase Ste14